MSSSSRRSPDLFSAAELELGGGLPPRGMELLKREKLSPMPVLDAVRGGRPYWDYDALCRVAVIGLVFASVPSLVLAGRLANVLVDEFKNLRGSFPSNLHRFREIQPMLRGVDSDAHGNVIEPAVHRRLREHPEIYTPGKTFKDDYRIYIVDRRFVFSGSTGNIPFLGLSGSSLPVLPVFIIEGWGRGGSSDQIEVKPFATCLPPNWWEDEMQMDQAAVAERTAMDIWENASSTVGLNVSLGIRQALDRIYDQRHSLHKGGSTDV